MHTLQNNTRETMSSTTSQIKQFGERPGQGPVQADLLKNKKNSVGRDPPETGRVPIRPPPLIGTTQADLLPKKKKPTETGILGELFSSWYSTPSASTSPTNSEHASGNSNNNNHGSQKEFGERPVPSDAPIQANFIPAITTSSSGTPTNGTNNNNKGRPADPQGIYIPSLVNETASARNIKEFGERRPSGVRPTVMEEELEKVTAVKASPKIGKPVSKALLQKQQQHQHQQATKVTKMFGEQQRRGNEGWTQDKYLLTIKKTDHPDEKDRKLQIEKQLQREFQSSPPPPPPPSFSSSPPKNQTIKQTPAASQGSPISKIPAMFTGISSLTSSVAAARVIPPSLGSPSAPVIKKEFGERANPVMSPQQDKFLQSAVSVHKQQQTSSVFGGVGLASLLPKSLVPTVFTGGKSSETYEHHIGAVVEDETLNFKMTV